MFNRKLAKELQKWANKPERKPLVLRGARQVGKTTLVQQFSKNFEHYIYLNLEKPDDRKPFRDFTNIKELVEAIFFLKNIPISQIKKALLFIDEIQEEPIAIQQIRYFYEEVPELCLIAAGSLLETTLNEKINIPVGRAEYLAVRPVSFPEFLEAIGEQEALKQITNIPLPSFAHDKLLKLFHTYTFIGGMPEIVRHYAEKRDLTALKPVYESLIVSYLNDVEKYASNHTMSNLIRHAIRSAFREAGTRIKFEGFGKSNYRSREMGEALRILEKTMILQLVYPTTDNKPPSGPDFRKSPRLQMLDTGMVNYFAGLQSDLLGMKDLNEMYQGKVAEHIVGQEILAADFNILHRLSFWVRQKKGSSAEVDYLYLFDNLLIPLEVKSGAGGRLRSLHLFMQQAPHKLAIRLYSGKVYQEEIRTPEGIKYQLLNLPYYLVSQLDYYLQWFREETKIRYNQYDTLNTKGNENSPSH